MWDQRIRRKGPKNSKLDLVKDLLLYLSEFLEGVDRLKVELCLNRRLQARVFYKLLIEHEHYEEKHVKILTFKAGDIWWRNWDRRKKISMELTSMYIIDKTYTTIRCTFLDNCLPYQHRRTVIHGNIPTRRATRRVIRVIENGRFDVFASGPARISYKGLRRLTPYTRSRQVKWGVR